MPAVRIRKPLTVKQNVIESPAACAQTPDGSRRPRVLLIAESCNPQMTSVPLVGYSHSEALREVADVLVVTHIRNRSNLTSVGWEEGKDFICIDTEGVSRWVWKISTFLSGGRGAGWTTLSAAAIPLYYLFEQRLWEQLARADYRWRLRHRPSADSPDPDSSESDRLSLPAAWHSLHRWSPQRRLALAVRVWRYAHQGT